MSTPSSPQTIALHALINAQLSTTTPGNPEDSRGEIEALLDDGADLNYPSLDDAGEAFYPLALACSAGSSEWVGFLLGLGARVDMEPMPEGLANEDLPSPVSPFAPLGRAINHLEYELEDDGDGLEDHSRGPVKVVELLLAAGADLFLSDPYGYDSPFAVWFKSVGQRLEGHLGLSEAQVSTVVEVTDMFLDVLPDHESRLFREEVLSEGASSLDSPGKVIPNHYQVREMLKYWPKRLLGAWQSHAVATAMEAHIPQPEDLEGPSASPIRSPSMPAGRNPGRM